MAMRALCISKLMAVNFFHSSITFHVPFACQ
jgi:hypothetical protein